MEAAEKYGVPVFNSPFSNTRSVAELIIAEIIILSRRLGDKSAEMHKGVWDKSAKDCHEIRGKILGIVGYGHIGSQLSVLAESLGMQIIFYDTASVLSLGNSKKCDTLEDLLREADFVTLHVPKTDQTYNMITERELNTMKKGSYLLNASRGTVVNIADLASALKSGRIAGAAVDVFPTEPESNIKCWLNELQQCPNTLLTPHIGGSTEEAQYSIGMEVSEKIHKLINCGSTLTSVNFPQLELPVTKGTYRILNIHKNVPGVLKNINGVLADLYNNIVSQVFGTKGTVGYLILDCERATSQAIQREMDTLPTTMRTRILY
jgi:D-3-phosphoglycerate dehydrogenase